MHHLRLVLFGSLNGKRYGEQNKTGV